MRLRADLSDAGTDAVVHRPNMRMPSGGFATMDVWFDNVISDLMVHDRISSSITEPERAERSIDGLLAEVEPREQMLADGVTQLGFEARRAAPPSMIRPGSST